MNLGDRYWLEPTVGVRYTYTSFGGNASALGLRDGDSLRVQGGTRIGTSWGMPDHSMLTVSLTGLLYSDVMINGYVSSSSGLPPSVAQVDEGKLRAMGILNGKLTNASGMTVYAEGDIRGGDNVIGYGGRAGVRFEW